MQLKLSLNKISVVKQWLLVGTLILAGIGIYSNIYSSPFIFDSELRIRDNITIRQLWPIWGWLTYGQRPFAYFTLALNYALHGYQVWGYHAVNVIIHLMASILLFRFVQFTLNTKSVSQVYQQHATALAFAITLLWLVHPLQTQSVTYTIQRIESLMGLLYIATLYCFIRSQFSSFPIRWLVVSACCCWLGMATKEVMVTAPLLALWYDRVFLASSWRHIWASRRWYYISLYTSWLLLTYLVSQMAHYGKTAIVVEGVTPLHYALSQPGVILYYLYLSIWPVAQCLDYGWPVADSVAAILPPTIILTGLLAATIWCIFHRPHLGFAAGCMFLILAPTSSVMPIADLAFEHRMYLPLAALCTLSVVAGFEFLQWLIRHRPPRRGVFVAGAVTALVASSTILGSLSYRRNQDYQSAISIWLDVIQKAPHHTRGYNNLGVQLLKSGYVDESMKHFRHVISMDPNDVDAYSNLGMALIRKGNLHEAFQVLTTALKLDPKFALAHNYLGIALKQTNQLDKAIDSFHTALKFNPHLATAHSNLGVVLAHSGDFEQALEHFRLAVYLDPYDAVYHYNLGSALVDRDELDEAVRQYELAIELQPRYANAHFKLGRIRATQHRMQEALFHFTQTLQVNPTHRPARKALAAWHLRQARTALGQKQWDAARHHYSRVLQLLPDSAQAHNELGEVFLANRQTEKALQHFREALRLQPDFAQAQHNLKLTQGD